ncbi:MAG: bifunctional phosphopantothenoylcysteine decarboxylase/phosphopantothenate--cysteine ligase CoaBC [Candidatus Gastranaerophilales bacterium]|nr:bifunctional phosphopantothenoylcysteine decarboxylase/phosphopantothenate--cysteine ligase CoaBC [Candidatus Gastranaerophilales bacterium]
MKDKNVLIGITGGIAAYKICDLIRMFKKNGANVKVIATENALNFVTKLTLQTLSQNPVYIKQFDVEDYKPEHISLADEADIFVIAPASANTVSKLAGGICDNLLTSVACAFVKPIILAPAMNCNMWESPVIQENIAKLEDLGYVVLSPEEGFLACGYNGSGRLCSIEQIFDKTVEILNSKKKLLNKKIVITAGGTKEKIDAVRFISNFSSGKMGIALADEAYNLGADVVLITTQCPPPQPSPSRGEGEVQASCKKNTSINQGAQADLGPSPPLRGRVGVGGSYHIEFVQTALEMKEAVEKEFTDADCLIMAAAVADYRAKEVADFKMKKTSEDEISISLVKTPDILKEISQKKSKNQLVIGFCAESENVVENAKEKIKKKGCDYLIANDISRSDIGFSSNYNEVYIINKSLNVTKIEKATKTQVAKEIFEVILH